ncbi:MAG: hypothetical protein V1725_02035 [archaeon]
MQKQSSPEEKQAQLCQAYQKKLDYLLARRLVVEEETNQLFQDFFRDYLGLKYAFTHHELKKELDKLYLTQMAKQEISLFLEEFTFVRFSDEQKLTEGQLRQFLHRFGSILDLLVPEMYGQKRKVPKAQTKIDAAFIAALADKIISLERGQKEQMASESEQNEQITLNVPLALEETGGVERVRILLEKTYALLNKKRKRDAKKNYVRLLNVYDALSPEEQSQCYLSIEQIYKQLTIS